MDSYVYWKMMFHIDELRMLAGDDSYILLAIDEVEEAVNQARDEEEN